MGLGGRSCPRRARELSKSALEGLAGPVLVDIVVVLIASSDNAEQSEAQRTAHADAREETIPGAGRFSACGRVGAMTGWAPTRPGYSFVHHGRETPPKSEEPISKSDAACSWREKRAPTGVVTPLGG